MTTVKKRRRNGKRFRSLKWLIKTNGRTQEWVRMELKKKGIKRSKSYFSLICKGKHTPRDDIFYILTSEILGVDVDDVFFCFRNKRRLIMLKDKVKYETLKREEDKWILEMRMKERLEKINKPKKKEPEKYEDFDSFFDNVKL